MISCLEVRRLAPRFVALELPPDDERELREHLAGCAACREAVVAREPALELVWKMAAETGPAEYERFVAEVLAQIHQRRLERKLSGTWSRVLAAAAAVLVTVLGGTAVVRELSRPTPPSTVATVAAPRPRPAAAEAAFIEVDGVGVRLYQFAPVSQSRDAIQVAFIVDPHLEL